MNYKIILFDLDGTLFDPKIALLKSIAYALEKIGIQENNLERLTYFIGPPIQESFQKRYNLDEKTKWEATNHFRQHLAEHSMYEYILYPGIVDLLNNLKQKGKILYVATLKPTVLSKKIINHFGLQPYFQKVLGPDLEGKITTKDVIIQELMNFHLGETKESFVMVGDRKHDIIGAKANGIDSIAITFGYGSKEEIENAKPTYIADSVNKLEKLL